MTLEVMGHLLLVGGGKMAEALLDVWLAGGLDPARVTVVEPDPGRLEELGRKLGVTVLPAPPAGGDPPALVLFAVKPQVLASILADYRASVGPDTLVLSIAAGKTTGFFEAALPAGTAIVRAMPNTPAAVGRGVSVLFANSACTLAQRAEAQALMAAVGAVRWIEDETLMHAVTALSGSGPAYLFHLIEAMGEAGQRAGLSEELARDLARLTATGAAELAWRSDRSPGELREAVTSPGGTTAAALRELMGKNGLTDLMDRAVAAAAQRSRELD